MRIFTSYVSPCDDSANIKLTAGETTQHDLD